MELYPFLKSIVDTDCCPVVVCNIEHEILYMNPAAKKRYAGQGGKSLIGSSLLACHNEASGKKIREVVDWFCQDPDHTVIYTYRNEKENKDVYMVALRDETGSLIGYYEKHEYRSPETMALYQGLCGG
ncbi:hypothetical protein IMSAGC012_01881 [Lachnospiraceae bacterium]|nr:hypothetical protein IMSAGC012_01881 [Lachnospiraceae bacterium]